MKKVKNIFAIFFATFFLSATNGVSFIQYCCNLCEKHGTEILTTGCHEHAGCCELPFDHTHQCQIKRYTLDDGELSFATSFSLNTTEFALCRFLTGINDPYVSGNKNVFSSGYVYNSGRSLLSHICVLTI